MRGRRWIDWVETDGDDVTRLDRIRAVLLVVWPFLACAAAVAVVLAATIVSVRAIRDRDSLHEVAVASAAAARDARHAAERADENAASAKAMLEAQAARDATRGTEVDGYIRRIIDDSADAHAALLGEIARLLNRPAPAAATPLPRAMASLPGSPPSATPAAAPASDPEPSDTTTTTCEQAGRSGRCKR